MPSDRLNPLTLGIAVIGLVCTQQAAVAQTPPPSAYVKPKIAHESYGEMKIAVPLTSDDKGLQRMKLANISNSLKAADEWKGRFTIKVVLYGKGVTLLKDPDEETRKLVDTLRSHGVQFRVCNNSLAAMGIDFHTLHGVAESDIVPSGFVEIAYLQAKQGYAVDPSN